MTWLGQKINQYTIIERKGSSMNVYVGRDEVVKKDMIVKAFATNLNESDQKAMEAEMKVGMQLSHTCAFLVKYEEMIIKKDNSFLIMEYCKGGNLSMMIQERIKTNRSFTDEEIFRFFYQAGNGVRTLHEANIVHRDLKTENIFLTENFIFKIGDFGIARIAGKTTVLMASIGYAPPEVFDGVDKPTKAMDIYSLGCMGLEMIDMHHPFANEKNVVQQRRVLSGTVNPSKRALSPAVKTLRDFALRMVSENPGNRPTIEELLALPVIVSHAMTVYTIGLSTDFATMRAERERDELMRKVEAMEQEITRLRQALAQAQAQAQAPQQGQGKAEECLLPVCLVEDTSNDQGVVTVTSNPVKCIWNKYKNFWGILDVKMSSGIYNVLIEASTHSGLEDLGFGLTHESLINRHAHSSLFNQKDAWCMGDGGIYNIYSERQDMPVFAVNLFQGVKRVRLGLELNADTHTLYFFVEDRQIPYCVADVPPSTHFVFNNDTDGLEVEVKSLRKCVASTIDSAMMCALSSWNKPI